MKINVSDIINFEGRIGRKEYFISYLLSTSLLFGIMIAMNTPSGFVAILCLISLLIVIYFRLAQNARRCHDLGKNGFYQFIPFYVIALLFVEGEDEKNQYGLPIQ